MYNFTTPTDTCQAGVQVHRPSVFRHRRSRTVVATLCTLFLVVCHGINYQYKVPGTRAVAVIVGNRTAIRAFSQSRRVSNQISRHLFTGSNSDPDYVRATHRCPCAGRRVAHVTYRGIRTVVMT